MMNRIWPLYVAVGLITVGIMGSVLTGSIGPGFMSGWAGVGSHMMAGRNPGRPWMAPGTTVNTPPLSTQAAQGAAERFLASRGNPELAVAEVMVFSNHAYVAVKEKDGTGAFELLVNPQDMTVGPEPGPNMMWNTKYAPMAGMNRAGTTSGEMISSAQASQAAQRYLDASMPGTKASNDAQRFYGYYTLDIERDGHPVGMLSVHGYTQAVFFHHWHGAFVAEAHIG